VRIVFLLEHFKDFDDEEEEEEYRQLVLKS